MFDESIIGQIGMLDVKLIKQNYNVRIKCIWGFCECVGVCVTCVGCWFDFEYYIIYILRILVRLKLIAAPAGFNFAVNVSNIFRLFNIC